MTLRLGETLLAKKAITEAQLLEALETQKQVGGKLGSILVMLEFVTDDQLAKFLGEQLRLPVLGLTDLVVHPDASSLIDLELIEKHQILPVKREGDSLQIAMVDPLDLAAVDEIHFVTGLRMNLAVATRATINTAINYYFHGVACPEIHDAEQKAGMPVASRKVEQPVRLRAAPQVVVQALAELLIEKKVITQAELMGKLSGKELVG